MDKKMNRGGKKGGGSPVTQVDQAIQLIDEEKDRNDIQEDWDALKPTCPGEPSSNIIIAAFRAMIKDKIATHEYHPGIDKPALASFPMPQFAMDEEQANCVVEDMKAFWPKVENITPQRVMLLKNGMIAAGIKPSYRILEAFIAEGCRRLSIIPKVTPDTAMAVAKGAFERCEKEYPTGKATRPVHELPKNMLASLRKPDWNAVVKEATANEKLKTEQK
ncbi:hypothetical protein BGZ60DRAFT_528326 [Tricladium varicosporioides]|nr:hypothetical protein BGZ60DRAFT_528326 [Hymenoscyphus varicosporioides]